MDSYARGRLLTSRPHLRNKLQPQYEIGASNLSRLRTHFKKAVLKWIPRHVDLEAYLVKETHLLKAERDALVTPGYVVIAGARTSGPRGGIHIMGQRGVGARKVDREKIMRPKFDSRSVFCYSPQTDDRCLLVRGVYMPPSVDATLEDARGRTELSGTSPPRAGLPTLAIGDLYPNAWNEFAVSRWP